MMLDVFQKHLDNVSEALMTDDFDRYAGLVASPLVVITEQATTVITDIDDLRFGFDSYVNMLRTERATDLIRLASSVSEYTPGLITGRLETHILRSGKRVYSPVSSAVTLVRQNDIWRVNSVVSPLHAVDWRSHGQRNYRDVGWSI